MPSKGEAAALFDGRHDLQLAEAQVAARLLTQSWPVGAEDIRDLQGGTFHVGYGAEVGPGSNGPIT